MLAFVYNARQGTGHPELLPRNSRLYSLTTLFLSPVPSLTLGHCVGIWRKSKLIEKIWRTFCFYNLTNDFNTISLTFPANVDTPPGGEYSGTYIAFLLVCLKGELHFNCNSMIIASDRLEIKKSLNINTRLLLPKGRIQQLHRHIHFIPIHSFYSYPYHNYVDTLI